MDNDFPQTQCRNPDCHCAVSAEGEYCSDSCREAVEQKGIGDDPTHTEGVCHCSHPECGGDPHTSRLSALLRK